MVTPRTCRLCPAPSLFVLPPLCAAHLNEFEVSGEGRRADGIQREFDAGLIDRHRKESRYDTAVTDYITRVTAEREVERSVRPRGES